MSWRTHRPTRATAEQRKRDASREAQRTGVDAEALVESIGAEYKDAVLRKRHEPYRRIGGAGKGGVFKAVNTGSSGPDFEIWLRDGRAGFIEVKSRKGARVPLAAVGDAQALALRRCVEWGHLSFVLVRLDHEWFLVHYSAWTHHKKRSLNRTDLSVQGAQCAVDERGRPDFLSVLAQAERAAAVYIESFPKRGDDEGESSAP